MFRKAVLGLVTGAIIGAAGLAATAGTASAGVKVYLNPVPYGAYGHTYQPNYTHEYSPRCHWKKRRVRRKVCWRDHYGYKKCRWKRRWKRVRVCN